MDMNQLTHIFCEIDDFCKDFHHYEMSNFLPANKRKRGPDGLLSESEIMTILILFQSSGWRNFKNFYTRFLSTYLKSEFPTLPSYNRFIEIMHRVLFHLILFSQLKSGKRTGIYFVDSTCMPACHIKRSRRNKSFEKTAEYGRTSVGWFFGLKLHIVINDGGELIAFKITRGNEHDAKACESMLQLLNGTAFGDKGYLGKELFNRLLNNGLKLITRKRKNMAPGDYSTLEKQLLNQRGIIETVINHLKNHYQIWHTRHRSLINAMTHLVGGLAAYVIEPLKISAIKKLTGNKALTQV